MNDLEFIVEEGKITYGGIKSYKDLMVWKKAMDLVEEVYRISKLLPDDEKYGLISQIKRASVSVPSNIAEGWGRNSIGSYIHHLKIANGSLCEIDTQIILVRRLSFRESSELEKLNTLVSETGKMLRALISSLEKYNN